MSKLASWKIQQISSRRSSITHQIPNEENLKLIAISNLRSDSERNLRAWWHRKYSIPPKPIEDYTFEELSLEYFEDFYYERPDKAEEYLKEMQGKKEEASSHFVVPEHVKKMLAKRKDEIDISRYQTDGDEDLSDEECQEIFDSIRGVEQMAPVQGGLTHHDDIEDDFTTE